VDATHVAHVTDRQSAKVPQEVHASEQCAARHVSSAAALALFSTGVAAVQERLHPTSVGAQAERQS